MTLSLESLHDKYRKLDLYTFRENEVLTPNMKFTINRSKYNSSHYVNIYIDDIIIGVIRGVVSVNGFDIRNEIICKSEKKEHIEFLYKEIDYFLKYTKITEQIEKSKKDEMKRKEFLSIQISEAFESRMK